MTDQRRAGRGERGVTMVEAAFALPILLTFMFGLVDLGMWTLNANQATNAARDGARAAILHFEQADVPNSETWDRIVSAVESNLDRAVDSVTVTCVDPADVTISCANARVDVDRVRVEAEWHWDLLTPIAAIVGYDDGRASGSATMHIVGRPLAPGAGDGTGATGGDGGGGDGASNEEEWADVELPEIAPAECEGEWVSVSTAVTTTKHGSKQLATPLDFTFTTNGSLGCSDLKLRVVSPPWNSGNQKRDESIFVCGCEQGGSNTYTGSYVGSDNFWWAASGWEAVLMNHDEVLDTHSFYVSAGS